MRVLLLFKQIGKSAFMRKWFSIQWTDSIPENYFHCCGFRFSIMLSAIATLILFQDFYEESILSDIGFKAWKCESYNEFAVSFSMPKIALVPSYLSLTLLQIGWALFRTPNQLFGRAYRFWTSWSLLLTNQQSKAICHALWQI